jgi:tetratricopeptide (TPR) repeat protein
MIRRILHLLCMILLLGFGQAADLPFVFNDNSSSVANYTSVQLKSISASSPELAGVPPISSPADNEVLIFPSTGNKTTNIKEHSTVGEVKRLYSARAMQEKGIVLLNLGNYNESLQAFDQATKLSPRDADNWNNKGIVLAKIGKYDQATKCFDRAINLKRSFIEPWLNKARVLWEMEKYQDALKLCDRAISMNKEYGRSWYLKGLILKAEADTAYEKAIELGY